MANQRKADFDTRIYLRDNDGKTTGTLILTSGGADFYPKHAKKAKAGCSLKRLGEVLMKHCKY